MTREKLTELGFVNIPKSTALETHNVMHSQIDANGNLADAVLDELDAWHAPEVVCEDNHESVLDAWVDEKSSLLHREM